MTILLRRGRLLGAGSYGTPPSPQDRLVDLRVGSGSVLAIDGRLEPTSDDQVVDLDGRCVMPGLRDAHTHVVGAALARSSVDLEHASSAREVADLVADRHRELASGEVLWGSGFHDARFPDAPHRDLLDGAAPGRVVVLASHDGHSAWVSSPTLELAGAKHDTGMLRETEVIAVHEAVPSPPPDLIDRWVREVLADGAARGLTEILDIDLVGDGWSGWTRRADAAGGALGMRVWVASTPGSLDAAIDARRSTGTRDGMLVAGYLKLFADGALGSRTALCDHDYPDRPGYRGVQLLSVEEMEALIRRAHDGDIVTAIHAIGDAANRNALDAFARAGVGGRIEHAQLLARPDVGRFRDQRIVASVQPSHLLDDRDIADEHWRGWTDRAYTFADLRRAGATLEFGSDAPVAPFDPWRSIAAAVARTTGGELPPWHAEQRVDLDTAIAASTTTPGLEVGAAADLVVLGEHPATLPPTDLGDIPVLATMLAGRWTHRVDEAEADAGTGERPAP